MAKKVNEKNKQIKDLEENYKIGIKYYEEVEEKSENKNKK